MYPVLLVRAGIARRQQVLVALVRRTRSLPFHVLQCVGRRRLCGVRVLLARLILKTKFNAYTLLKIIYLAMVLLGYLKQCLAGRIAHSRVQHERRFHTVDADVGRRIRAVLLVQRSRMSANRAANASLVMFFIGVNTPQLTSPETQTPRRLHSKCPPDCRRRAPSDPSSSCPC